MRKILFIIPDLGQGGTNSALEALYNNIKAFYEVRIFSISHQPQSRQFIFDEVLMPQNWKLSLLYSDFDKQVGLTKFLAFFLKVLQGCLRFFKVDLIAIFGKKVVHSLEISDNYDGVVAFQEGIATKFGALFNTPNKTAWVHCNYDKWLPTGESEENIYKKYKHIVCVSDFTASVFANRYPRLSEKTIGIRNFVDFKAILYKGNQPIEDNRFTTEVFTIISAGRFHPVKQFREIPHIAAKIKEGGCRFNWYVLGETSGTDEISAFNEGLSHFDVGDCVKWLGGKVNPFPYFKASDLFVCTSESEACPMIFIEAKILGVPIVSTDFGSVYEFLKDYYDGRIVSLDRIADAIIELITDKSLYNSIRDVNKNYSFNNTVLLEKIKTIL